MKILKKIILILIMLIIIVVSVFSFLGYKEYRDAINEISIKDKVEEIRSQKDYVTFDNISKDLINATIAIEDRRFYDHGGVDYIALVRTITTNILAGEILGGGSTITQQLAKNMYFGYNPSIIRKVSEVFVAKDLENNYSKEEIIELYVNIINYGDNHIGIKQAANGYFNIEPSQLDLSQGSLLAGIPQSPSNLQLSNHKEAAQSRQKAVLAAMLKEAMISKTQETSAQFK